MKKVLSTIVAALSAVSFVAIVSAADVPAATDTSAPAVSTDKEQAAKPVKKEKKAKKHHKKSSKKSSKKSMKKENGAAKSGSSTMPSEGATPATPATPAAPAAK